MSFLHFEWNAVAMIRFGTFEVDLQAGELRKQGRKIKLQEKPLLLLTILLERPGEVVTREELQKRLWPEDYGFRARRQLHDFR